MFPVTLTFNNVNQPPITVNPPCYGFLKNGQWGGGEDEDYSIDYPVSTGWHSLHTSHYGFEDSLEYDGYQEERVLGSMLDITDLKGIWNSGPHFYEIGVCEGINTVKQFINWQDCGGMCDINDASMTYPQSAVEIWSKKNKRPDVTMEVVMDMFEEYLDKDLPSCFLWDQKTGCFGVDASSPADRCLFYLMLNRFLWEEHESSSAQLMLDQMFLEGEKPMMAFFLARLLSTSQRLGSKTKEVFWSGSDNDSCILPMSLISVGHAAMFDEPVQVHWRQDPYTAGDGHFRDDDYASLEREIGRYSRLSNSMFLPILHPPQVIDTKTPIKGDAVFIAFAKEVVLDQEDFDELVSYGAGGTYNTYRFIDKIHSYSYGDTPKTKPKDEWIGILKNLLSSK